MRMTAIVAAVASCVLLGALHTVKADALSPEILNVNESSSLLEEIQLAQAELVDAENAPQETAKESQKVSHLVEAGDSLIKIAKQYDVDWKRIYYKNQNISHPDLLEIDQKLIIPNDEEELEEREIVFAQPEAPAAATISTASVSRAPAASASTTRRPMAVAGNRYVRGYCTWYVKNRRSDLPNNLGNANTWVRRAAAQGFATGSAPRVGAVGQARSGMMHVAYVEAVHANGTVTVSEMNFRGFGVVSSRTVPASSFTYIY